VRDPKHEASKALIDAVLLPDLPPDAGSAL
jgi:hypothetical protein